MEKFEEKINQITGNLWSYLLKGDLLKFEEDLYQACTELYSQLAYVFIASAAETAELEEKARTLAQKKGLGECRREEVELELKTGHVIRIFSWYAVHSKSKRKKKRGPNRSGCHLILSYWGCIEKATPGYYSLVAMLAILCPSFEVVMRVLQDQKIQAEYKRVRTIVYRVCEKCFAERIKIGLKPGENLIGKRVIISIDGGRTRTRIVNPKKKRSKGNKGKREKFDTPWREPKLFVIHTLEKDGSVSKVELPIYDCLIDKPDACFDLLSEYLKQLQIEKATQILFIADGAIWIWERVKPMLLSLGVDSGKIFEAVDYYHAVEHLSAIMRIFSDKRISKEQKTAWVQELKNDLYNGQIDQLIEKVSRLANGRKRILKELEYFRKNKHRLQYRILRQNHLPCGSGIIESAIRRIINLRFKCPSCFWQERNVEKLIFLRGIFLASRWNIMIQNLAQKNLRLMKLGQAA